MGRGIWDEGIGSAILLEGGSQRATRIWIRVDGIGKGIQCACCKQERKNE
jgi:hypothetical protein